MIAAVDRFAVDGSDDDVETLRTRIGNLESQLDRKQDLIVSQQAHARLMERQLEVLHEIAELAGYRRDEGFTAASLVARLKDGDR
jgi:uncharacterized protein YPO0396